MEPPFTQQHSSPIALLLHLLPHHIYMCVYIYTRSPSPLLTQKPSNPTTHQEPEMAAAAYDAAALQLRGPDTRFNFPGLVDRLPKPASANADDIRQAKMWMELAGPSMLGEAANYGETHTDEYDEMESYSIWD